MKVLKNSIYVALVVFLTMATGCSSDDDSNPEETGQSGAPHTYDITIDGERFSGEIDNVSPYGEDTGANGATPALSFVTQAEGVTNVILGLKDNAMDVSASFTYPTGQANNIPFDSDASIIFIPSNGIGYNSNTGTATITLGESTDIPGSMGQFTAVKIEFDGEFGYEDENNNAESASVSGFFMANLPEGGI